MSARTAKGDITWGAGGMETTKRHRISISFLLTAGDPEAYRSPGNAISKLIKQVGSFYPFFPFKPVDICQTTCNC